MPYENLENLKALEDYFQQRISLNGGVTAIIGGHYALEFDRHHVRPGTEDMDRFGIFPQYTLNLAAKLISESKKSGRDCKLALLVDDHALMNPRDWYNRDDDKSLEIRKKVEDYFSNFQLPKEYQTILEKHGLSVEDLVMSVEGSKHVFQEHLYREKFIRERGVDLGCSGEFELILAELGSKKFDQVLALIPKRCSQPTACALTNYNFTTGCEKSAMHGITGVFAYLPSNEEYSNLQELEDYCEENGVLTFGDLKS